MANVNSVNHELISKENLEEIRQDLNTHKPELVLSALVNTKARNELARYIRHHFDSYIKRNKEITEYILREIVGIGFLEDLLLNPKITDIGWNGTFLTVETNDDKLSITTQELGEGIDDEYIVRIIQKFAASEGKEFNGTLPILDALQDGLRLSATHKSNSPYGTTMSIRITRPKLALNQNNFKIFAPEYILEFIHKIMITRANIAISGITGTGKSVINSTLVKGIGFRNGAKPIGELQVGDVIFGQDGSPTTVTGVYPQGKLPVYRVHLKDGRYLDVNDSHIWTVQTLKKKIVDMTTREMIEAGIHTKPTKTGSKSFKYAIPMNGAVQYPEVQLKVNPYVLGVFIGNGSLVGNELTLSAPDDEIPEIIAQYLTNLYQVDIHTERKSENEYTYFFYYTNAGKRTKVKTNDIFPKEWCHYSHEKFIPKEYLTASVEQRLDLFRGLMDTDGSVYSSTSDGANRHRVRYGTVSPQLKDDIIELIRSLGLGVTVGDLTRKGKRTEYDIRIQCPNVYKQFLFKHSTSKLNRARELADIPDKKNFDWVKIVDIEYLGYAEEQTCIKVDAPNHLFQAGDYIVTHNTEVQKLMMSYIPNTERVIMIEDVLETHAKELFPDKDIYSWITSPEHPITEFVKAALRNNPKWVLVSETRGAEAYEMLQAILTGNNIVTTLHSINAAAIPKRFANMIANQFQNVNENSLMEDILRYFDFGFHIEKIFIRDEETGEGKLIRYLQEIREFDFDETGDKSRTLFKQRFSRGTFYVTTGQLSDSFRERMEKNFLDYTFPQLDDVPRTDLLDTKEGQLLEKLKKTFNEGIKDVDSTLYKGYEEDINNFELQQMLEAGMDLEEAQELLSQNQQQQQYQQQVQQNNIYSNIPDQMQMQQDVQNPYQMNQQPQNNPYVTPDNPMNQGMNQNPYAAPEAQMTNNTDMYQQQMQNQAMQMMQGQSDTFVQQQQKVEQNKQKGFLNKLKKK